MKSIRVILNAGLIVGTLDIVAAFTQYMISTGKNPIIVLKFIASGLIGNTAFISGTAVSLLGMLIHYFIAFTFTLLFYMLFSRTEMTTGRKVLTGVFYGVFTWFFMRFAVLPFAKTPKMPFELNTMLLANLILIICIGLPLAFLMIRKPDLT
ncbi:MAG: hypothetical protein EOP47_25330 [Sphingobacteriaceae bacterium]|nr:MAG: hypothetical protein EOP47_25330 [Sphingobacteriaceae bacterium]